MFAARDQAANAAHAVAISVPDAWLDAQPAEVAEAEPEPEIEPVSGFTMATPAAANAATAEPPAESGFMQIPATNNEPAFYLNRETGERLYSSASSAAASSVSSAGSDPGSIGPSVSQAGTEVLLRKHVSLLIISFFQPFLILNRIVKPSLEFEYHHRLVLQGLDLLELSCPPEPKHVLFCHSLEPIFLSGPFECGHHSHTRA